LFFAGAVGLSNCPGAPRLRFFVGRNKTSGVAPSGLVPAPFHSVDTILSRMQDAGFSPDETVILLASHSIGTQHTIDPTVNACKVHNLRIFGLLILMFQGISLDSTPKDFDSQFYLDVRLLLVWQGPC
jgi:manganese peroxidase